MRGLPTRRGRAAPPFLLGIILCCHTRRRRGLYDQSRLPCMVCRDRGAEPSRHARPFDSPATMAAVATAAAFRALAATPRSTIERELVKAAGTHTPLVGEPGPHNRAQRPTTSPGVWDPTRRSRPIGVLQAPPHVASCHCPPFTHTCAGREGGGRRRDRGGLGVGTWDLTSPYCPQPCVHRPPPHFYPFPPPACSVATCLKAGRLLNQHAVRTAGAPAAVDATAAAGEESAGPCAGHTGPSRFQARSADFCCMHVASLCYPPFLLRMHALVALPSLPRFVSALFSSRRTHRFPSLPWHAHKCPRHTLDTSGTQRVPHHPCRLASPSPTPFLARLTGTPTHPLTLPLHRQGPDPPPVLTRLIGGPALCLHLTRVFVACTLLVAAQVTVSPGNTGCHCCNVPGFWHS
eukprot:361445-Chlamydomonas_euryale.AAC.8